MKEWTGTVSIKGIGAGAAGGMTIKYQMTASAKYSLDHLVQTTDCARPDQPARWNGKYSDSVTVDEEHLIPCRSGNDRLTWKGAGSSPVPPGPLRMLEFDLKNGTYTILFRPLILTDFTGTPCSGQVVKNQVFWTPFPDQPVLWGMPLPAVGPALSGSTRFRATFLTVPGDWELTWNFVGTAVELVIDPTPYTTWRPVAGPDENTPPPADKDLEIRATLQQVGGQPTPVKAKKFTFELIKTSQQPGITMNYPPLEIARTTFDLQFLSERNSELEISNEGQTAKTPPGEYTKASAFVTPLDWGAWSRIKVTAEMPDGPPIVGYLRGDKTQTEIYLPKRAPDSRIADVWKSEKGVSLPDDDDKEKEPEGMPGCDGDGLTLYEEYRGFRENGEHIEGNPKKKDLFVRNLGGGELDLGIERFAGVTGLEVHKDLDNWELDSENRIINRNHINRNQTDQAAHLVEQHGLILDVCSSMQNLLGGTRVARRDAGFRGRPKNVKRVCIAETGDFIDTASTVLEGLSFQDQLNLVEKVVAHELTHAVGVEHHGEQDYRLSLDLLSSADAANPHGRPVFVSNGTLITLLDEKTDRDLAPEWLANVERQMVKMREFLTALGIYSDEEIAGMMEVDRIWRTHGIVLYVGSPHGQHSGHELCLQRYCFADAYLAWDRADLAETYYLVAPETERAGLELCDSPAGTGINASGRRPRPRYLDASRGRGSCKKWICVNDVYPLLKHTPPIEVKP